MLRARIGSFIPHNPDTFEAELRAWLESRGTLSTVEGRGLEVIWARHKSSAGSNLMKIGEVLNSAPRPLSIRKLLNRLTDMTEAEIRGALKRMVRDGEVAASPKMAGNYKYFVYSITEDGRSRWEERCEKYEQGKPWALEIWRVFKAQGLKRGSQVDPKELLAQLKAWETTPGSVDDKGFWAGWRTLVAAGRITVAYNAEGAGKHLHFLA